jgi:hypothetical protein
MDEFLLFTGLNLSCFGLGCSFGFGLTVSLTATPIYLPPPPGLPGTYFSFLRGSPPTTAGSGFTESWRGVLELFLSASQESSGILVKKKAPYRETGAKKKANNCQRKKRVVNECWL